MESGLIQLSRYRFNRAAEMLEASKTLLEQKSYASSVNRSYYSIFHALRAVTALDSFDSSYPHSSGGKGRKGGPGWRKGAG